MDVEVIILDEKLRSVAPCHRTCFEIENAKDPLKKQRRSKKSSELILLNSRMLSI